MSDLTSRAHSPMAASVDVQPKERHARHASRGRLLLALKAFALVGFVVLLGRALAQCDWTGAAARLRALGPAALLVLLPFPLGLALDTAAWSRLLARLGHRVPLPRLYRVRLATETLTTALPAGGLAAEALSPFLVARVAHSEARRDLFGAALTSSAMKRWLIIRTHGYYVALAALVGFGALSAASRALLRHDGLAWIVLATAFGLVAVSMVLQRATSELGIASRVHDGIARLRSSRLFARFASRELRREAFERVDADLARLGKGAHPVSAALILGTWLLESVETFLILSVLGAHVPFLTVLSFDAALSVVRTAAVFAPAGVGAQDLGYLAFFEACGVPDPAAIGPAFLVLKRLNQILWVFAGAVLLFSFSRLRPEARSPEPPRAERAA
jgi:hypothetical protein